MIKLFLIAFITIGLNTAYSETVSPAPNGIKYPTGLKNWRLIATSYRNDNNTQRAILGNSIAIKAARAGEINPWPQGSILAKLVWKNATHPQWKAAIVAGDFIHSEIMVKDSKKYSTTKGWGYARWKGASQEPYGKDNTFSAECVACHNHAKDSDFVFTIPAQIP